MKKQPVVFDIDGTLTSEPYNENNLRTLRENSAMMLVALGLQLDLPLLVSTARPERFRDDTEKWLASHGLKPVEIFMRDNSREGVPDHMIKFGHLQDIRKKYGDPLVWVDDNSDNIHMLRKNDVPVIHVNREE
jgi:phosphoglycolate phosphatase-like HAD superfamily hydrolase